MTIFHHLRLLMGNPLIQPLFLLTTISSLGAIAMISVERKLLQAVTTPGCYHSIFPPSNWKLNFWSFLAICACSRVTSWSQLRFYWQNNYHRVLLQWYQWRKSYSRLLPPHFPFIDLKIQFLAIFGHFSPFAPTHVWPLDPASAYWQKCFHRVLLQR